MKLAQSTQEATRLREQNEMLQKQNEALEEDVTEMIDLKLRLAEYEAEYDAGGRDADD